MPRRSKNKLSQVTLEKSNEVHKKELTKEPEDTFYPVQSRSCNTSCQQACTQPIPPFDSFCAKSEGTRDFTIVDMDLPIPGMEITVTSSGKYNILFNADVDMPGMGVHIAEFKLKINDNPVFAGSRFVRNEFAPRVRDDMTLHKCCVTLCAGDTIRVDINYFSTMSSNVIIRHRVLSATRIA